MIKDFTTFQKELSNSRRIALLEHYSKIYECNELTLHEMKITFLAYLWKNGQIGEDSEGYTFMLGEHGTDFQDYQSTFEALDGNGSVINLNVLYDYFDFKTMIPMIL